MANPHDPTLGQAGAPSHDDSKGDETAPPSLKERLDALTKDKDFQTWLATTTNKYHYILDKLAQ